MFCNTHSIPISTLFHNLYSLDSPVNKNMSNMRRNEVSMAEMKRYARHRKRKRTLERELADNDIRASRLKRRLDKDAKKEYFKECFNEKQFKACNRLIDEDADRRIDYLNQRFISDVVGHPEFDKWNWLLNHGVSADARHRDSGGASTTMLMEAAERGDVKVCELILVSCPETINERSQGLSDWTALMYAASNDNLETCKLLVNSGANIDIESSNNKTALEIARSNNASETVEYLESV